MALGVAAVVCFGGAAGARAQTGEDPVAEMRAEIEALRSEYAERIEALEHRLAQLEGEQPTGGPAGDSIADLEAAARAAAGATASEQTVAEAPPVGRERNLSRLNPEISMTGIVLGTDSNVERREFRAAEFEVDLQSALDPFSRTRLTLAFREGEVEVEEGYIAYSSLPGGLELMAGRFRQRFGALNRQHLHALPQSGYPLAYQSYFGEEGLGQTGLSFTWLLPKPWASANEVTLEITNGENEQAFSGESFEDFAVLGRVKNFWDTSDATWFEWGLSGIAGKTAAGGDSRVWGTDLTFHWQPPGRAKYRELTWRSEALLSERDDDLAVRQEALGLYSYLEGLVRRNLYVGVRYDRVENALVPDIVTEGIVPYLTWWQSEFVRLRAEYAIFETDLTGEREDRFTLQLTWAAGPHKHSSY